MDIDLQPGMYVVAVSGGVDSVALLHLLKDVPGLRLTVAHYDHGIREDSAEDRQLVQALAREHGLPFVYQSGNLGSQASEASARQARYDFLHQVRGASGARSVVTAHHQDDVLETAILNLLRGTSWRGLSSLKSTDVVKRPLLHVPKDELIRYAKRNGLQWREDSTNADERYARNYVRSRIMSRYAEQDREALLGIIRRAADLSVEIEKQAINYLHLQPAVGVLDRHSFIMLPHAVAKEVMAEWLRQNTQVEISTGMLERLLVAAKTGQPGTRVDVSGSHWLEIGRTHLALRVRER